MTECVDIPEELVERVKDALKRTEMSDGDWFVDMLATWGDEEDTAARLAQAAIRAVLDWQAKEWVEIPRLDRGGE